MATSACQNLVASARATDLRQDEISKLFGESATRLQVLPVRRDVAAFALLPKTTIVHIVLGVAGVAGHRNAQILVCRFVMALHAGDVLMTAVQRKLSLVVIKIPNAPVARVVALRALRAEQFLMHIVLDVTSDAFHLRVFVAKREMAFLALNALMFSEQWEA